MKTPRTRILLADDHALLLDAFRQLLEPAYEVVAVVTDGRALLEAAERLRPDVVIADISMPLLNGLDACEQLSARLPRTKVIVLTMNEDPDIAAEALRRGAAGFALKKSASSELFDAIDAVLRGQTYLSPAISSLPASTFLATAPESSSVLTQRQREVLQLLAEGKSMKEAAAILNLTPRTIAFHKYAIMEQHGLATSAELVCFAVKQGLVKE